ncbi:MAG: nuclear transport factor 2 family protein [Bacteroidota bacterium]
MKSIFTIALLLFAATAFAQSNDVRAAVLDYVEGFYEGDTVKLKRSVSAKLFKYGYWRDKQTGKYGGEPMTFREAVDYTKGVMTKKRFAKADAPKTIVILDEEEQVAAAKLTAWWGIDYLLLAKHDGKWMIEQVLWQGPVETVKKL